MFTGPPRGFCHHLLIFKGFDKTSISFAWPQNTCSIPQETKEATELNFEVFLTGYRIAFSWCEWTVAIYLSFTVMIMTLCIGRALYCSKIFTGKLFNSSYHLMVLRLNTGIIHVCLNLTPPVSKLSEMKKNNHIFIL